MISHLIHYDTGPRLPPQRLSSNLPAVLCPRRIIALQWPRHTCARGMLCGCAMLSAVLTFAPRGVLAYDLHFDYTSFENSTGKHFQQAQFDVLNYPSINGNYMMTSTDNHRPEMVANGNALAQFYSPFCCATGSDYLDNPRPTAIEEA